MLNSFKIGHFTDLKAATGCTLILPPENNIAAACVRGAAPGTREVALLEPGRKILSIHGLFLTGGSAFGLGAAQAIMEALAKQGIGYQTHFGVVPIIPAAVIFDRNIGQSEAYPKHTDALAALGDARYQNTASGSVGAGTGATVGKWAGLDHAMKGGLGIAQLARGKLKCLALAVVNSVGDVLSADGEIMAGAIDRQGSFLATGQIERRWRSPEVGLAENTVLVAVMTNLKVTKTEAYFLAERAHFGIARSVDPSHTSFDGDVSFVIANPEVDGDLDTAANMMVHTVSESIRHAVRQAESVDGVTAWKELKHG